MITRTLVGSALSGSLLALLTAGGALAAQSAPGAHVKITRHAEHDGERQQEVEIVVEDGEVTAMVNGERVPADRIRREGDRVIILDAFGQPIPWVGGAGDGEAFAWAWAAGDPLEIGPEPPVMVGVTMSHPGPALEKHLGLEPGATTLITGVREGLPAAEAGLEEHDLIIDVEGRTPADPASIREMLADRQAGDRLDMTILREGRRQRMTLTLAAYDRQKLGAGAAGAHQWQWMLSGDDEDAVVVGPGSELFGHLRALEHQAHDQARRALEHAPQMRERLESRIESLTERMADLETMLEQLLDRLEER